MNFTDEENKEIREVFDGMCETMKGQKWPADIPVAFSKHHRAMLTTGRVVAFDLTLRIDPDSQLIREGVGS